MNKILYRIKIIPAIESIEFALNLIQKGINRYISCCSENFIMNLSLIIEEALINIVKHGYPEDSENAEIELICFHDSISSELIFQFIDNGIPFDILSVPEPNLNIPLEKKRKGGLGVYFIKRLSDSVIYRRENEKNILQLYKKIPVID